MASDSSSSVRLIRLPSLSRASTARGFFGSSARRTVATSNTRRTVANRFMARLALLAGWCERKAASGSWGGLFSDHNLDAEIARHGDAPGARLEAQAQFPLAGGPALVFGA